MSEMKVSDLSVPASALLKDDRSYDQFPIWRETVQTLMELKEVYYEFIMLDENPVLSELLEETRIAMVEARESLAREPNDSARATALAAISAKHEKLQKTLEEETPASRASIARKNVIAKVILQRSTTIKAYLKYPKSAWSLWRKILSDHRVQAEAYVEDLKRELEYLVLNANETIKAWQCRVEELCAQIEYHGGEAVPRRRIVGRVLKEVTNVHKHLAWATDPRLVALKAKYDNYEVVALEDAWNLLKTLELEYPDKRRGPQGSTSTPQVLALQQEQTVAEFQSKLDKLEHRLEALQSSGRAQTVTPSVKGSSAQRKKTSKPKRVAPQGCPKGTCYSYWESGVCPNGASCKYTHTRSLNTGSARAATTATLGYAFTVHHACSSIDELFPSDSESANTHSDDEDEDEPYPTYFSSLRYIDEIEEFELHGWYDGMTFVHKGTSFPDSDHFEDIDSAFTDFLSSPAHSLPPLKRHCGCVKSSSSCEHDSIEPEFKKLMLEFTVGEV